MSPLRGHVSAGKNDDSNLQRLEFQHTHDQSFWWNWVFGVLLKYVFTFLVFAELNWTSLLQVLFLIIYVYWTVTVSFKTAVGMNDCSCNPDIQLVSSCSSSALGHVTAPVTLNSAHALSSFRTCCLAVAGWRSREECVCVCVCVLLHRDMHTRCMGYITFPKIPRVPGVPRARGGHLSDSVKPG